MSASGPPFPVRPEKAEALRRRMAALAIFESELEERFFHATPSKRGRRSRSHCAGVELFHRRSGHRIRCAKSTSQALNRFLARRELVRRLERHAGAPAEGSSCPSVTFPAGEPASNPLEHLSRLLSLRSEEPHLRRLRTLFRNADHKPPFRHPSGGSSSHTAPSARQGPNSRARAPSKTRSREP